MFLPARLLGGIIFRTSQLPAKGRGGFLSGERRRGLRLQGRTKLRKIKIETIALSTAKLTSAFESSGTARDAQYSGSISRPIFYTLTGPHSGPFPSLLDCTRQRTVLSRLLVSQRFPFLEDTSRSERVFGSSESQAVPSVEDR